MVKYLIRIFIVVVTLLILRLSIQGQQTTARLTINSGGSVNFYVNTFDKYQNGITYNNWTTVTVYFIDTLAGAIPTGMLWKLDVKAMAGNISGTLGNLNLNTIELVATHGGGPAATFSPVFALSAIDQSLVTAGAQTNVAVPVLTTVNITYHCGKSITVADNSLLGKMPDYYAVDIQLTLRED